MAHHPFSNSRPRERDLPKGVYKSGRKYRARGAHANRIQHIGTFEKVEEAERAYLTWEEKVRGKLPESWLEETLSRGILLDQEDQGLLEDQLWSIGRDGYAWRNGKSEGRGRILLHKEILNTEKQVDHINRNRLDNRRRNLREAEPSQQQQNCYRERYAGRKTSSPYKGVYWYKAYEKWHASITLPNSGRKRRFLGYFDNEREAALAYDRAARELFGGFAKTNSDLGFL